MGECRRRRRRRRRLASSGQRRWSELIPGAGRGKIRLLVRRRPERARSSLLVLLTRRARSRAGLDWRLSRRAIIRQRGSRQRRRRRRRRLGLSKKYKLPSLAISRSRAHLAGELARRPLSGAAAADRRSGRRPNRRRLVIGFASKRSSDRAAQGWEARGGSVLVTSRETITAPIEKLRPPRADRWALSGQRWRPHFNSPAA